MRVLLTGAFGNVGTETIRELLAAGHQVRTFDLATPRNEKIAAQFGRQIETGWGDLTKPGDVLAAVADREAVIHDAAIIPPASENDADLTHAVNVEGTRNVIAACEAQPSMPRLVFTSSVTVFGPCQDKAPPRRVDEPLVPTDNYTHSKVRCEEMIRA
jgi:UDP-glucose 4-epimerase